MDKLTGAIKRINQPSLADYKISAEILQGAIKRRQVQPDFNRQRQIARENYDLATLNELSKPYLIKDLKTAWKNEMYSMTIYKKPLNKLKKAELYHELLNVNHNFSNIPKRVVRARRRRAPP